MANMTNMPDMLLPYRMPWRATSGIDRRDATPLANRHQHRTRRTDAPGQHSPVSSLMSLSVSGALDSAQHPGPVDSSIAWSAVWPSHPVPLPIHVLPSCGCNLQSQRPGLTFTFLHLGPRQLVQRLVSQQLPFSPALCVSTVAWFITTLGQFAGEATTTRDSTRPKLLGPLGHALFALQLLH
jgi:hypothetical protein